MGGVARAVTNVVGDAVEAVGDVVDDVGKVVVDDVLKPVVKIVEATVEQALEDPVGTAIKVAAISTMNPAIIAAANAGVAVAHGASLEDAALAAGKGYVAGVIGAEVSSGLQPEFAQSGDLTASQAAAAAKVAGQVAGTAAVGGDPLQALISGGVGAGTSALTADIPGFNEMSKAQQQAVNSAISKTLQGRDPSQGLLNEAIASGIGAAQSASNSSAPSDELMKQTVTSEGPAPLETPAPTPTVDQAPSTELLDQTMPTQNQEPLIASAPVADSVDNLLASSNEPININAGLLGMNTAESLSGLPGADANAPDNIDAGGGWNPLSYLTSDPNAPDNIDAGGGWSPATGATEEELKAARDALDAQDPFKKLDSSSTDLGALARSLLAATPAGLKSKALGVGAALGAKALLDSGSPDGLSYTREAVQNQGAGWNPQSGSVNNGAAWGLDQLGTTYTTKAAQGGIMSLAQGGQIPSLGGYAAGGNPRLLRGPGDGMSDNIPATIAGKQPARLADGEFVVPADVVSHLGNGSTEAGANVLHQMMERVRKARTGNAKQGRQINPQKFVPNKGK